MVLGDRKNADTFLVEPVVVTCVVSKTSARVNRFCRISVFSGTSPSTIGNVLVVHGVKALKAHDRVWSVELYAGQVVCENWRLIARFEQLLSIYSQDRVTT
ncbi:hypothetical protein D3C78_1768470 [compost metagenome]